MHKKGWLRIVEASISILLVLGFLFFLYTKNSVANEPELSEEARTILNELSARPDMREAILNGDNEALSQETARYISDASLAFEIKICDLQDACGKSVYTEGNVYAAERVVSASIEQNAAELSPKKVRLFIWRNLS